MTEPTVLRWPMPGRVTVGRGETLACPVCGAVERLVLGMDLDDRSEEPSYMACPGGHTWAEGRLPRWFGALLLADILDIEPSILDDLQREHGAG